MEVGQRRWGPLWPLMLAASLILAGCNNESTTSTLGSASAANEEEQTSQDTRAPAKGAGNPARTPEQEALIEGDGSEAPREQDPDLIVEDPIFADPIPVPVPDDAEPEVADEDPVEQEPAGKKPTGEKPADDPVTAEPEPEDREPEPVADRPTLQWDSPMTREDGSKLFPGEISGYRVYFRLRHQDKFQVMAVDGPDSNSLQLNDFDSGAYEFAISTVDSDGLESRRSEAVPVDLI